MNKHPYLRKYFFDLDDGSGANANANETEEAIDALELAKQSEASLNNLLDLQDNDDDDLLLAEIGKSKQKQSGIQFATLLHCKEPY